MSARSDWVVRALEPTGRFAELPQARDIISVELLAGSSGVPLEWARRFHRDYFDFVEIAVELRNLVALDGVVISRPNPCALEFQRWAHTWGEQDRLDMSPVDIARHFTDDPAFAATIVTADDLRELLLDEAPFIDDGDLRRLMTTALLVDTSVMLARLAPHVRVGNGMVLAYRRCSLLDLLIQDRRRDHTGGTGGAGQDRDSIGSAGGDSSTGSVGPLSSSNGG
jgi:hypothetical protein